MTHEKFKTFQIYLGSEDSVHANGYEDVSGRHYLDGLLTVHRSRSEEASHIDSAATDLLHDSIVPIRRNTTDGVPNTNEVRCH